MPNTSWIYSLLKGAIVIFLIIYCSSCFQLFEPGANTFLKESYNPHRTKKAILFEKIGNATLDNSLQVSVVDYDHRLNNEEVGNTFTTDSNHNSALQDSSSISFTWLTNDTLKIDYKKNLRIFMQYTLVKGVTIIYESR